MDIVAEGVETEIEAVMMTHFGCTELQGYYFSKPIDADQMSNFLSVFQPNTSSSEAGRDRLIQRDACNWDLHFGSRARNLGSELRRGGRRVHRKASRKQFYAIAHPAMLTINGRNSIPKRIFNIIMVSRMPTTIWSSAER